MEESCPRPCALWRRDRKLLACTDGASSLSLLWEAKLFVIIGPKNDVCVLSWHLPSSELKADHVPIHSGFLFPKLCILPLHSLWAPLNIF